MAGAVNAQSAATKCQTSRHLDLWRLALTCIQLPIRAVLRVIRACYRAQLVMTCDHEYVHVTPDWRDCIKCRRAEDYWGHYGSFAGFVGCSLLAIIAAPFVALIALALIAIDWLRKPLPRRDQH